MNQKYYTAERSVQILISLLKQHGIKRIVASPGTTNLTFVASIMQDSWFEMYSSVDERSAADTVRTLSGHAYRSASLFRSPGPGDVYPASE